MRTEAIEKEAALYQHEGECYIHIERTKDSPFTFIVAGDDKVIAQAVYNMISAVADSQKVSFPEALKMFKRAYKKAGIQKPFYVREE